MPSRACCSPVTVSVENGTLSASAVAQRRPGRSSSRRSPRRRAPPTPTPGGCGRRARRGRSSSTRGGQCPSRSVGAVCAELVWSPGEAEASPRRSGASVVVGRLHDEHGAGRVLHDVAADRAEHERLHGAAAAAADDDQLGIARVVDDRRAGRRLDDDEVDQVGLVARDRLDRAPEQLLVGFLVRRRCRSARSWSGRSPASPARSSTRAPRARACRASTPRGARTAAPPWPHPTRRRRSRSWLERTTARRDLCRMDGRDRSSLRHRYPTDAGDACRHRRRRRR